MKRIIYSALVASIAIYAAATASAQEVMVYAPIQPEYRIGSFIYHAPTTDGWRQVSASGTAFRMVWAEMLDASTVNTRADVVTEAFFIEDPELVPDAQHLALSSQKQQMDIRGDQLVGYTPLQSLGADVAGYMYTLATTLTAETKRYETFIVALAPDKSEYLVAKLTIDEEQYNEQPFFLGYLDSLASLSHSRSADDADSDDEQDQDKEDSDGADLDAAGDSADSDSDNGATPSE